MTEKTVFIVASGCWSQKAMEAAFSSLEEAKEYVLTRLSDFPYDEVWIEECILNPLYKKRKNRRFVNDGYFETQADFIEKSEPSDPLYRVLVEFDEQGEL